LSSAGQGRNVEGKKREEVVTEAREGKNFRKVVEQDARQTIPQAENGMEVAYAPEGPEEESVQKRNTHFHLMHRVRRDERVGGRKSVGKRNKPIRRG